MDIKRMKQIFQEIEEMTGTSLGSYLRNGGRNTQQLNRIFEDEFTCSQLEALKDTLDNYIATNKTSMEDMDPEFVDQYKQIVAIQKSVESTANDLNYTITNLPNLLEMIVQSQLRDIMNCYKKNHTNDYPNMKESLRLLKEKGFQERYEEMLAG